MIVTVSDDNVIFHDPENGSKWIECISGVMEHIPTDWNEFIAQGNLYGIIKMEAQKLQESKTHLDGIRTEANVCDYKEDLAHLAASCAYALEHCARF